MIRIRPEQLKIFEPVAEAGMVRRLVEHLRAEHADYVEGLPDDILSEMTRNGVARARRYGLTLESSIGAFVALMFEVAPNFDEHPLIRHALTDASVPPDERIDELPKRVPQAHWEEAGRRYDEKAWFPEVQEISE